jgi:hypothetical protein
MAARKLEKTRKKTNPDDLQQNEDERGSIQPLLKTTSEAAEALNETHQDSTANVRRRLDERWTA